MLDTGLLLTGAAIWLVLTLASRWAPGVIAGGEALDRLAVPAVAGLLVARLAAAILDDPASLQSLRSFLVIRGGVDFWPGVAATVGLLALGARRRRGRVAFDLADLAPLLLWGYATYEAACLLREGCYGPPSPLGLTPDGLRTQMFPVGVAVAVVIGALGLAVRQLWAWSPLSRIVLAVGGVAAVRSVAAIWLPRLGPGPTRSHVESIVVLAGALAAGLVMAVRARRSSATGAGPIPTDRP